MACGARAAVTKTIGFIILALLLHAGGPSWLRRRQAPSPALIVDPQGLAVPGVTITVTGPQGAKTAVTETSGRFTVPFLVPGTYTVRSELQGFKPVERQNVTVGLGQTVELNLKMDVGGLTETVQVSSASPVIDSSSTTIGANIDSELLEPSSGRTTIQRHAVRRAGRQHAAAPSARRTPRFQAEAAWRISTSLTA